MRKFSALIVSSIMFVTFSAPAIASPSETQLKTALSSGMVIPDSCTETLKKIQPPPVIATNTPAVKETAQVSRSDSGDVRKVIQVAQSLLGSKYKYGASGPKAFDCSGFVMYVYDKLGVNLPHNAAEQYQRGKQVDKSNLEPGDLVFFSYYGKKGIQHSGIYIGDNKFIHASTNNGVIVTSLSTDYYANNYKGATRIIR